MSSFQSSSNPDYSGKETLELMNLARNYNKEITKKIHRNAPKLNDMSVFDFGAGSGLFTQIWGSYKTVDIKAIELDSEQATAIEKKGISVISLDKIPDNSADYIYSINVLEHIEDDRSIIAKIFRKLKPGGHFYTYVPAHNFLWTQMDDHVGHVRRYSLPELNNKLKDVGFDLVTSTYADSMGVLVTLIFKLLSGNGARLSRTNIIIFDRFIFPLSKLFDTFGASKILGKNISLLAKRPSN
jgi:SAM-dependent methyltransferase